MVVPPPDDECSGRATRPTLGRRVLLVVGAVLLVLLSVAMGAASFLLSIRGVR
ncbi:hypothetical protein ACGFJC_11015 [Nonomuraea fuscirosea]|jgi:hypothetical protein|uniref:Uncharacterized protein n=1 Tax=Nonomuraea fuscirosea TaxID=1291556 RepID=A0A2T0MKM2_9ACTN|nr:hypothetical protein [Nonomuraea fuscirosea]PRX58193.1 hypothetical protein B0I32_124181 [Nonomuraea fuscirosea]WSA54992.1 hypothetical protein OIE67_10385 [Nonomuraea fuscirosea]